MNKISIIIPSHNNEAKISRCIESAISQTFRDLEIILIDDASTDNTLLYMKKYAELDSRIRVFHNPINMGAGYSRNIGIEAATGNYIAFIDADDFISEDAFENINKTIQEYGMPDIVRYRRTAYLDMNSLLINIDFFTNGVYNKKTGVVIPRQEQEYVALEAPNVCNKVFKRELIAETRFPTSKWEDYPFCTFLLGKAKEVVFSTKGEGYYCMPIGFNNTTLTDVKTASPRLLEIYDCCDLLEQFYMDEDLFEIFEKTIRGSQKIQASQRIRDIMFSNKYSQAEKEEIINYLIHLISIKYGDLFSDALYQKLKELRTFYRMRMNYIEKYFYNPELQLETQEEEVKAYIKRLIR